MSLKVIVTADGSHSLLNEELNETYHSVHGAVQESLHVFIKNGFDFLASKRKTGRIKILEVGMGTGLNALLTLQQCNQAKISVCYETLEAFPLDVATVKQLNYGTVSPLKNVAPYYEHLHLLPWNVNAEVTDYFQILKRSSRIQDVELDNEKFDLIYFDAFAPSKQPEMWTPAILEKVEHAMNPGAVFVTYCAQGQLKRNLKALGLLVETLPGPPGKKEMVRATKTA